MPNLNGEYRHWTFWNANESWLMNLEMVYQKDIAGCSLVENNKTMADKFVMS